MPHKDFKLIVINLPYYQNIAVLKNDLACQGLLPLFSSL